MLRGALIWLGLVWGAAIVAGTPAQAALNICNDTAGTRNVAVAYRDHEALISQGWWVIRPGQCKTVIGGDLTAGTYYYHASASRIPFKDADHIFCASKSSFKIEGRRDCRERGYRRLAFRQLDTGAVKDFTLSLEAGDGSANAVEPGQYGEPVSLTGTFRGCVTEQGLRLCGITDGQWTYVVVKDERTPSPVFAMLEAAGVGSTLRVDGDIVAETATHVAMTARRVTVPVDRVSLHGQLRGTWRSLDDPASTIRFEEGRYTALHRGQRLHVGRYELDGFCGGGHADMAVRVEGDDIPYCYEIDHVDSAGLRLTLLARGHTLSYERVAN